MAHLNAWCGTVNLATEPELTQITENLNVCRLRACSTVRRRVDGAWSGQARVADHRGLRPRCELRRPLRPQGLLHGRPGRTRIPRVDRAGRPEEVRAARRDRRAQRRRGEPRTQAGEQRPARTADPGPAGAHARTRRRFRRGASKRGHRPRRSRTGTSRGPWRRRRPRFRKARPRRRVLPRSRRPHRARSVRCPRSRSPTAPYPCLPPPFRPARTTSRSNTAAWPTLATPSVGLVDGSGWRT
jgi:hypothetical protein